MFLKKKIAYPIDSKQPLPIHPLFLDKQETIELMGNSDVKPGWTRVISKNKDGFCIIDGYFVENQLQGIGRFIAITYQSLNQQVDYQEPSVTSDESGNIVKTTHYQDTTGKKLNNQCIVVSLHNMTQTELIAYNPREYTD